MLSLISTSYPDWCADSLSHGRRAAWCGVAAVQTTEILAAVFQLRRAQVMVLTEIRR